MFKEFWNSTYLSEYFSKGNVCVYTVFQYYGCVLEIHINGSIYSV